MNGKQEYEAVRLRRINTLLQNNDEYLTSYYAYIGMNKSLETRYNYLNYVLHFVRSANKPVTELSMNDFTLYISNIYATKSSSYAITTYSALKLFGQYLYASETLSKNPMEYVQRPKYVETKEMVEKREIGYLTKKEIRHVKEEINNGVGKYSCKGRQRPFKNRDMLIITMLLSTGIRCSALTRLDVTDINVVEKEFIMYDKGNKVNKYKLPDSVIECYNNWLVDRDQILKKSNSTSKALFISRNKNRMDQKSISRIVEKFTASTGKHITPHKLRATYGTQLYNATHDIYFVQQCMHHSNPKTTELYIRGRQADTDRSADIMSKLL